MVPVCISPLATMSTGLAEGALPPKHSSRVRNKCVRSGGARTGSQSETRRLRSLLGVC
jgi:hypothetical protein